MISYHISEYRDILKTASRSARIAQRFHARQQISEHFRLANHKTPDKHYFYPAALIDNKTHDFAAMCMHPSEIQIILLPIEKNL